MTHQVKDLMLSLQWLKLLWRYGFDTGPHSGLKDPVLHLWHRSQLQLRFSPWPRNFHMLRVQLKKEEEKKKKNKHELDGSVSVGLQAETD